MILAGPVTSTRVAQPALPGLLSLPLHRRLLQRAHAYPQGAAGDLAIPRTPPHKTVRFASFHHRLGGDCGNPLKRCRRQNPDGGNISQMGSFGNLEVLVIFYLYENIICVYTFILELSMRVFLAGTDCQF